jgi:hypothetical protein
MITPFREIELKEEHCIITSISDECTLMNEEESSEPDHASNRCGHIIFQNAVDEHASIQIHMNRCIAI